jgi:hypothetical protein
MIEWANCFEFESFSPTPVQAKSLHKVWEDLVWLAPSDSTVKIKVQKNKALYCVQGSIHSASGHFAAEGLSQDFIPALKIMESGLQRELNRWKQTRQLSVEFTDNEQRVS